MTVTLGCQQETSIFCYYLREKRAHPVTNFQKTLFLKMTLYLSLKIGLKKKNGSETVVTFHFAQRCLDSDAQNLSDSIHFTSQSDGI